MHDPGGKSGGYAVESCGSGKISSVFFAPVRSTGRNSCRYTFSVTTVLMCPTSAAMSSIGTPWLDISDAKVLMSW